MPSLNEAFGKIRVGDCRNEIEILEIEMADLKAKLLVFTEEADQGRIKDEEISTIKQTLSETNKRLEQAEIIIDLNHKLFQKEREYKTALARERSEAHKQRNAQRIGELMQENTLLRVERNQAQGALKIGPRNAVHPHALASEIANVRAERDSLASSNNDLQKRLSVLEKGEAVTIFKEQACAANIESIKTKQVIQELQDSLKKEKKEKEFYEKLWSDSHENIYKITVEKSTERMMDILVSINKTRIDIIKMKNEKKGKLGQSAQAIINRLGEMEDRIKSEYEIVVRTVSDQITREVEDSKIKDRKIDEFSKLVQNLIPEIIKIYDMTRKFAGTKAQYKEIYDFILKSEHTAAIQKAVNGDLHEIIMARLAEAERSLEEQVNQPDSSLGLLNAIAGDLHSAMNAVTLARPQSGEFASKDRNSDLL